MLLQMILNQPQVLGTIARNTPVWVWGLLAALMALGLTQARDRTASFARIAVMPVVMAALSLWGMFSAFGSASMFGYVLLAWLVTAAAMAVLVGSLTAPHGTRYDARSQSFALPGSLVPLVLILGIFLTRYVVGVETRIDPALARDGDYTLVVGALYGMFSGVFAGRAMRLLRLARRPAYPIVAA